MPRTAAGERLRKPPEVRSVAATALATLLVSLVCVVSTAAPAHATPPNIPSYSTAVSRLAALTVAAESHESS